MKVYKWLRGLMKASALTTVMFIMQACYGVPRTEARLIHISGYVVDKANGQPLNGIQLGISDMDGDGRYGYTVTDYNGYFEMAHYGDMDRVTNLSLVIEEQYGIFSRFDTVLTSDTDLTDLKIRLERHQ